MQSYTKIFIPVFLAIALGSLTFAFAQTNKETAGTSGDGQRQGFRPPPGGRGPGGLPPRVLDKLNLTDEQKQQIKALHESSRTSDQTYFEAARSADEKLRAMIDGGTFNEAQAREILTAKAQAMTEIELSHLKTEAAIKNILTAEQKTQLEQLKKQGPPAGFRGPGGPGGPGGFGGPGRDLAPPPPPQDNQ